MRPLHFDKQAVPSIARRTRHIVDERRRIIHREVADLEGLRVCAIGVVLHKATYLRRHRPSELLFNECCLNDSIRPDMPVHLDRVSPGNKFPNVPVRVLSAIVNVVVNDRRIVDQHRLAHDHKA